VPDLDRRGDAGDRGARGQLRRDPVPARGPGAADARAFARPRGRGQHHDSADGLDRPALRDPAFEPAPGALVTPGGGLMLRIRGLTRRYGPLLALDDVSLEVAPGEIVGLLGANGAGKSTLIRTAAGLQPPVDGAVEVQGVDLWKDPLPAKRQLGYAAEEPAFYEELSADEYLAFLATLR